MKNTSESGLPLIGRFVDPLTDFGFKRIFSSEPNKDLLIAFLNELFRGRKVIRNLVYNSQEKVGAAKDFRGSVFDLTCTGVDGEIFIIEMQRMEQAHFIDRAIFYIASKLHEFGPKGNSGWDYNLPEIYFIALVDFKLTDSPEGKYLHRVWLREEESKNIFHNKLGLIFLELPNFVLPSNAVLTGLDRWMFVLQNMGKMEKIPVFLQRRIFQKLFKIAEVANLKKEEYMLYERSLMEKWDAYAIKKFARENLKKALKEGMEKGIKEGREEGREAGIEEGKKLVVKNLLSSGKFTISEIASFAEVPEAFVRKIKNNTKK